MARTQYDFIVPVNRRSNPRRLMLYAGQAQDCSIDWSPWSEENGNVSAVTMTVESGDAAITNESLASNINSFTVTCANAGPSLIEVSATAGNNIHIMHVMIYARDPGLLTEDYGFFV